MFLAGAIDAACCVDKRNGQQRFACVVEAWLYSRVYRAQYYITSARPLWLSSASPLCAVWYPVTRIMYIKTGHAGHLYRNHVMHVPQMYIERKQMVGKQRKKSRRNILDISPASKIKKQHKLTKHNRNGCIHALRVCVVAAGIFKRHRQIQQNKNIQPTRRSTTTCVCF
jgi:hypothetical protein